MKYKKLTLVCLLTFAFIRSYSQSQVTAYNNGNLLQNTNTNAYGILSASDYKYGAFITMWASANVNNPGRLIFGSGYNSAQTTEAFTFYNKVGSMNGSDRRDLAILQNGNVLIGSPVAGETQNLTDYKLNVFGVVRARTVKCNTTGADFVFANDYKLRTLAEVEQYIKLNNHLPEVPSAAEMVQDGMDLEKVTTTLLQKVEELTLYIIEQDKKIELLSKKIK